MTQFEPHDRADRQTFEISKIQDGGGRHLENPKMTISRPLYERFDKIWQDDAFRPSKNLKFKIFKIQDGGNRHLEKSEIEIIMSATVCPIATKFGMMTQFDTCDVSHS